MIHIIVALGSKIGESDFLNANAEKKLKHVLDIITWGLETGWRRECPAKDGIELYSYNRGFQDRHSWIEACSHRNWYQVSPNTWPALKTSTHRHPRASSKRPSKISLHHSRLIDSLYLLRYISVRILLPQTFLPLSEEVESIPSSTFGSRTRQENLPHWLSIPVIVFVALLFARIFLCWICVFVLGFGFCRGDACWLGVIIEGRTFQATTSETHFDSILGIKPVNKWN